MSWSSGEDSTLALHKTRTSGEAEVTGLPTTVNSTAGCRAGGDARGPPLP